jgi:hypothetical protein
MLLTLLHKLMNRITRWFCRDHKPGPTPAAPGPIAQPEASEPPFDPYATLVDPLWLPNIPEQQEKRTEPKWR